MVNFIAQAALVHGGGIAIEDGRHFLPSDSMDRVGVARRLLADRVVDRVIVSGRGPFGEDMGCSVSEAELMWHALRDEGVDKSKILVEDESKSTIGNWALSGLLMKHEDIESVIGVTSRLCVPRMKRIGGLVLDHPELQGIDLIGYESAGSKASWGRVLTESGAMKSVLRRVALEAGSLVLAELFLQTHTHFPVAELGDAYEVYKSNFGANYLKQRSNRHLLDMQSSPEVYQETPPVP